MLLCDGIFPVNFWLLLHDPYFALVELISAKETKDGIIRVFFVTILFKFLASLFYSLALGATRFVKTTFATDYICIWTWPVFDLLVIVSIILLHYKSFG